jgi:hypothetical protein
VAKLYVSKCYFLCWHCNRLAYASQYEPPWQWARRRANKLRHRLGIDSGIVGQIGTSNARGCEQKAGRNFRVSGQDQYDLVDTGRNFRVSGQPFEKR